MDYSTSDGGCLLGGSPEGCRQDCDKCDLARESRKVYRNEDKLKYVFVLDQKPTSCGECPVICSKCARTIPKNCPLKEVCPECLSHEELEYSRFGPNGPEVVCNNCGWPDVKEEKDEQTKKE